MLYKLGSHFPDVSDSTYIAPGSHIIGQVAIGAQSSVWFTSVIRADNEAIKIGERTSIQEGSVLHVDEGFPLNIGAGVTVGHRAILHGCTIEDGALIGMGAIILNGAHIKKNAVVAAGALVSENQIVEEGKLAVGIPARTIKAVSEELQAAKEEGVEFYMMNGARFRKENIVDE